MAALSSKASLVFNLQTVHFKLPMTTFQSLDFPVFDGGCQKGVTLAHGKFVRLWYELCGVLASRVLAKIVEKTIFMTCWRGIRAVGHVCGTEQKLLL
jgi:hypothetical protein